MVRACHKTCRGRKQLTVLREVAHEGGTHREPNPHLVALPSAAHWATFLGTGRLLRQDVVLRLNYTDSTTPA